MNLQEDKKKISEAFFSGINFSNIHMYGIIKENFKVIEPVYALINFIISRLSTVTDLAIQGNNWDAEIIYRSALEAIIKFTFIVSATDEKERTDRLKEYWQDLCEISTIKSSEQAKKSLALYGHNPVLCMAFAPMLLSDEDEKKLRLKWSRSERKRLELKWSFSEMIASLSKSFLGKSEESFTGLGHNYRYASHVTHADETGVLMIVEREQRPKEEKEIADFAHYFRLLSDSFNFCTGMGMQVALLANKKDIFFSNLQDSMKEVNELGFSYLQELHKDDVYNKYR